MIQRIKPDRHAAQPVHVKDIDGVLQPGQFPGRAADNDHIARFIDPQFAAIGHERLQDLAHLLGGDILQRHDPDAVTALKLNIGRQGREIAARGLRSGQDPVNAVGLNDGGLVAREDLLQQRKQIGPAQRLGGCHGDRAAHLGVDHKAPLQQIAEDHLDEFINIRVLKIQRDIALG